MKDCEKFDSMIEEYLDGALSDEENKQFTEHISSCERCAESLENAKKMHEALSGIGYALEVPHDFCDNLHSKIEQLPKRRSIYTYTRRIGAIAACVVLAVVVAKNGIDSNLTKNADELKAEDSAGMAVNEVIKEAEDEIVKTINTTETTQDKTETSKEENNIQKKTTDMQGKIVTEKNKIPMPAETSKKDIADTKKAEEGIKVVDEGEFPRQFIVLDEEEPPETVPQTLSETAAADALATASEGAPISSGGGSSASAFSARRMIVLEMKVSIENIEKTNETALKYAPMQSGVYTMNKEKLQLLLKDLEAQGIGVSFPETAEAEEISFTVTAG